MDRLPLPYLQISILLFTPILALKGEGIGDRDFLPFGLFPGESELMREYSTGILSGTAWGFKSFRRYPLINPDFRSIRNHPFIANDNGV
jgi:hypothetical protein